MGAPHQHKKDPTMTPMQICVRNLLTITKPPLVESHKHCRKCGEDRPKTDFHVKRNRQLNHICLICAPRTDARRRPPRAKTTYRKTCEGCGKAFKTTNNTKKTCSTVCATKVHNRKARDRHRARIAGATAAYQKVAKERTATRVRA